MERLNRITQSGDSVTVYLLQKSKPPNASMPQACEPYTDLFHAVFPCAKARNDRH